VVRFFVSPSDISGSLIRLGDEDARHINSLRLRPDELFSVCDGEGTDYVCRLGSREVLSREPQTINDDARMGHGCSVAEIVDVQVSTGEPSVACRMFIAFAKGERLDYAVGKSVELGAADIVLFPSERCVSLPSNMSKKTARLQKIALETAKQCGRGRVPVISSVSSFESAILQAAGRESWRKDGSSEGNASLFSLFLYEQEDQLHLKQALEQRGAFDAISIITGPEGGFEPSEAEFARSIGIITVSLGPRVLRCETAPVAALAAVMFHTGNF